MKRAAIDWDNVRERLRASELALAEALAEGPERIEAAYRQRAVRLAQGQTEHEPASTGLPMLIFRLAQELYAIELQEVAEVLPFARCTRVPGGPPNFLGVINLRGDLRPVLDLGRLLAGSENGNSDSGFVLMLRRSGQEIGLKVDRIEELREIRPDDSGVVPGGRYVKGVASGALMLLSVDAVLGEVFLKEGVLSA
jgi:purine-binding chemotaxis protein CheW